MASTVCVFPPPVAVMVVLYARGGVSRVVMMVCVTGVPVVAGVHTVGLRVTVGLLLRTGSTAHVSVIDAEKSCVAVTVMAYVAVSPGATVCGEPETVRLKSPGDT